MANYNETPPDYGDLMTVEQYRKYVESGMFIDYDGSGCPVRDGKMDGKIDIIPSSPERIPDDATHIVWFNR